MGRHSIAHRSRLGSIQEFAARMIAHLGGTDPEPEPAPKPVVDEWVPPDVWLQQHSRKAGA